MTTLAAQGVGIPWQYDPGMMGDDGGNRSKPVSVMRIDDLVQGKENPNQFCDESQEKKED